MKKIIQYIQEKLIINKYSKLKTNILLNKDNLELIQKVFRFYVENFLSEYTIHNIATKNEIDDERYEYTIDEIIDIISGAKRENRSVRSILFNNEFKPNQNKEIIGQLEELFNKINNNKDKSFINQVKEEFLKAINYNN